MTTPLPGGVVDCKVFVAGTELSGTYEIASVAVFKEMNRIPAATVVFRDGDTALQDFEISAKADIEPGKEVEIKIGYDTVVTSVYKGIITKLSVVVRENYTYTQIDCKDKAVKMTVEKENAVYEKKKDSDVIKTLISAHGLTAKVDATTVQHPQLLKFNITDWDFTLVRGEVNGLLVNVEAGTVNVIKPVFSGSPALTLEFGTHILEFEGEIDATTQIKSVTSRSWDPKTQKILKNEVSSASGPTVGDLGWSKLKDVLAKGSMNYHTGQVTDPELKEWGTAELLRSQIAKNSGTVKCFGFAAIKITDILELKGLGKRFNGKVYVTGVQHEVINGTWTTTLQFGLTNRWFSEEFNVNTLPNSGMMPAVHGLQVGKVKKIDSDPDSEFRIQINLPIFGEDNKVWARMLFADAGKARGIFFLPEVDDEVMVGFMDNDPRFPVILGSLYSSKAAAPHTADNKNNEKGIVTKSKIKIWINDDDKSVTIETPGKNKIVIDDKAKQIELADQNKNKVTLSSSGIVLDSPKDIKITSKGKITIDSATGTDIKSKADVKVSGLNVVNQGKVGFTGKGSATAEVSASGQTTIKGAMVMIN
ncbi:MAG: type VI secretion system tip protein VgrG [Saprospiraceae bacterium]|nr:type VI secretion system tip protein VgrG [Saprospiraceae bacterium]